MSLASFSAGTEVWLHQQHHTVSETFQDQELIWHCILTNDEGSPRTFQIVKLFEELRLGNLRTSPPKLRPKDADGLRGRRITSSEAQLQNASSAERAVAVMRRWILNFLVSSNLLVRSPADWAVAQDEFLQVRSKQPEGKIEGAPLPPNLPSVATLNRWRNRFGARGLAGLLSRAKHRGGKGALRVDERIVERMTYSVDNYFLTPERRTIRDCWLQLKGEIEGYNDKRLPAEQIKVPSYSTYRRYVLSMPAYEIFASRYGQRAARHRFRSTEVVAGKIHGLNDLWLADHFLLRVIGMHTDGTPRGRPWVTIIADARTRYIVGLRVGYETLSAERLLDTIYDAIMPKDQERLAAMGVKSQWEACGIPLRIRMDNGSDFASLDTQRALDELDCGDEYCAVRSPWTKGGIERCIRTAHGDMQGLTGACLPPATVKALCLDRDPKLRPSQMPLMDHEMIEAAVFRWAIDEYNNRASTKLENKSPYEVWKALATPDRVDLPCDPELARLACMRQLTPTIQPFGLQIAGLRSFMHPQLQEIRLSLEHSLEQRVRVKVRYRPSKLDVVWVQDPRDESWFPVENKDPSTKDLSERQVAILRSIANLTTSATSADYAAARKRASDHSRDMRNRQSRAYQRWARTALDMPDSTAVLEAETSPRSQATYPSESATQPPTATQSAATREASRRSDRTAVTNTASAPATRATPSTGTPPTKATPKDLPIPIYEVN